MCSSQARRASGKDERERKKRIGSSLLAMGSKVTHEAVVL